VTNAGEAPGTGRPAGRTPDRATDLRAGLEGTRARIAVACLAAGRAPGEVSLVAVSKTFPLSDVDVLAAAGQLDFGESRAQECLPKASARPQLRWHFLGRLQTNKAVRVARLCVVVHSVDRPELLDPLARGGREREPEVDVYLQLSLDGDPNRGGASAADLPALADGVAERQGLRLAGVMALAPEVVDPRPHFARLRAASEALRRDHPDATGISAGMSGDLEAAVAEGATCVRVGSALFGGRGPVLG
jgi:pyridoxal phosphate enzyme (YggS family)